MIYKNRKDKKKQFPKLPVSVIICVRENLIPSQLPQREPVECTFLGSACLCWLLFLHCSLSLSQNINLSVWPRTLVLRPKMCEPHSRLVFAKAHAWFFPEFLP
jgi:hypothetical protein